MRPSALRREEPTAALPAPLPASEPYVMLPVPLAHDLRDSPLAVGIYLLVARVFLVQQGPVPLSAGDIEAYDGGGLRRGAILRALARLCEGGWLVRQARPGAKATYLPAWGAEGGAARPWRLDAPGLGRPRGVRSARVPRVVLDVCVGRLTPHPRHGALVERYVTRPPLGLRDLGAYGQGWAGLPRPEPALAQLGLAGPAGPLPPPDEAALLARISQRPLFDASPEAPGLSPRGLQRAGLLAPPPPPDAGPPLFFVPRELIGAMIPPVIDPVIGSLIGSEAEGCQAPTAPASAETGPARLPAATTGTPGKPASSAKQGTPHPGPAAPGRSRRSSRAAKARTTGSQPTAAETARPSSDLPPAAEATPAEATLAEELLRELGVYPSVARRHRHVAPAIVERAHTVARRLPGRRSVPATVIQLLLEEQASPGWLGRGWPDLFLSPMGAGSALAEATHADPAGPGGEGIEGGVEEGVGPEAAPAPGLAPPLLPAAAAPSERPAWIGAEEWGRLHVLARRALAGSRWEDGAIVGAGPGATRLLRTALAGLVARLRPPGE